LAVRRQGLPKARAHVAAQLSKDLKGIKPHDHKRLIVAYEPLWAIGTGRYDEPKDAREMAEFIKRKVNAGKKGSAVPVLYGGSVSNKNAGDYVQYNSIDGALVGGASLHAAEFKKIIKICQTT